MGGLRWTRGCGCARNGGRVRRCLDAVTLLVLRGWACRGLCVGASLRRQDTKDPINIAYSNAGLDLHMDLAYFESPPGLQLLHCLQVRAPFPLVRRAFSLLVCAAASAQRRAARKITEHTHSAGAAHRRAVVRPAPGLLRALTLSTGPPSHFSRFACVPPLIDGGARQFDDDIQGGLSQLVDGLRVAEVCPRSPSCSLVPPPPPRPVCASPHPPSVCAHARTWGTAHPG